MADYDRAAELERQHRAMLPELLDAFDHRHDSLTAKYKFDMKLKLYALMFCDGRKALALAPLIKAEKQLQRDRERRNAA